MRWGGDESTGGRGRGVPGASASDGLFTGTPVVKLPAWETYVPCIPVPAPTRFKSLISPILTFSSPTAVVIVLLIGVLRVAPNGTWTKAIGWRESLKRLEVRKKGERVSEEAREEEAREEEEGWRCWLRLQPPSSTPPQSHSTGGGSTWEHFL